MREILFRGKDIAGNWHYGVPLIFTEDYVCMSAPHTYNKCVKPETLGQFTGLTDKNGKRIFEGDILKTAFGVGAVNYGKGCYCVKCEGKNNPAIDIVMHNEDVFVIGNIHDNPELLKGGAE